MRELELATRIWVPDAVRIFRRGKPGPEWNPPGGIALIAQGSSPPALENKDQKQGSIAMPNENDLEGMPDQGGNMAARRACRQPSPSLPMVRIKVSCSMRRARSSCETGNGPGRSTRRIPSGDEAAIGAMTAAMLICIGTSPYWASVCLAAPVVPWHTFNQIGFGPVNSQVCHSKHQGSPALRPRHSALVDVCIDLSDQASTLAWKMPVSFPIEGAR
jgi:hypothetical protein